MSDTEAMDSCCRSIAQELFATFTLGESLTILANVAGALIGSMADDPDASYEAFCTMVDECLSARLAQMAQCEKPEGSIGCQ